MVLGITVGALVGIEGYNFLDLLGLGPATGIISSLVNTRELAPIAASLAFATQAGCRFTAQLGLDAHRRRGRRAWTPWRSGRFRIW